MIEPDQETIRVRMCNELVYCPRLFHLEHVQGIFVESADTIEGSGQHERAARRGKVKRRDGDPPAPPPEPEASEALPWDAQIPRNMEFASSAWGVHGRLDLVELAGDEVVAVEAKRGAAPRSDRHRWNDHELPYRAWPPDVAQLGASSPAGMTAPSSMSRAPAPSCARTATPSSSAPATRSPRGSCSRTSPTSLSTAGHEGEAAAHYFAVLPAILPPAWQRDFCGRSRRPPRDRVNALLSFGYSLLIRDATAAAARVGLDPMLGFLHVVHPGRPALALDLVEPFRAAWVDTAVLRLIATRGIDRDDFVFSSAGVALTDRGRRALIGAYERRADELTTHPRFGYRMSYRRLLELEARVLGKWLVGEIVQFTPIWTR